jgi:CheY-like chemotaxis protein
MQQPKKILLAEDDHDDMRLFDEFLNDRKDIQLVAVAENGVEVFDLLDKMEMNSNLPDLIVLDQNMPKKNGIQTLISLKSNRRFSTIPIIIYSTYTDEHLIKDCTEKGASMVVSKPVTRQGYQEMIDELLKLLES